MRLAPLFLLICLFYNTLGCVARPPEHTRRPELQTEPWQSLTVKSREVGQRYRYLFLESNAADAPSILLLHGGFFDQHIWLNMRDLARHFNVYALEWPDNSILYTGHVENYGEIAADFLQALNIKRVFVAGVSMGAFAAIDLVARKKEFDIPALFLFSSVMYAVNEEEVKKRTALVKRALSFSPNRLRRIVERRVNKADYDQADSRIQQKDIFFTRPYPYYYQIFTMALNQGAKKQATKEVTCPVLLLHGTKDETMPIDFARLAPPLFPDAELQEFENLKHSMVFSHGPVFAARMIEFLKKRQLL